LVLSGQTSREVAKVTKLAWSKEDMDWRLALTLLTMMGEVTFMKFGSSREVAKVTELTWSKEDMV
jgi:hypothetical protein